jgi:hypothetical protein
VRQLLALPPARLRTDERLSPEHLVWWLGLFLFLPIPVMPKHEHSNRRCQVGQRLRGVSAQTPLTNLKPRTDIPATCCPTETANAEGLA